MGVSKQDMAHRKSNLKGKLEELERQALNDPLKRNRKLHEEIAELKRKMGQLG
ncbi:hypothetical protein HY095_01445 [Candidatus Micrarchaeota archaeon]|nr:hypothetical protein [Candidatus Micrarchaeota archaeon]